MPRTYRAATRCVGPRSLAFAFGLARKGPASRARGAKRGQEDEGSATPGCPFPGAQGWLLGTNWVNRVSRQRAGTQKDTGKINAVQKGADFRWSTPYSPAQAILLLRAMQAHRRPPPKATHHSRRAHQDHQHNRDLAKAGHSATLPKEEQKQNHCSNGRRACRWCAHLHCTPQPSNKFGTRTRICSLDKHPGMRKSALNGLVAQW